MNTWVLLRINRNIMEFKVLLVFPFLLGLEIELIET